MKTKFYYFFIVALILVSCKSKVKKADTTNYFTSLPSAQTGLTFSNTLTPTDTLNMIKYMYYYNGAGVGSGDFNNDGMPDVFFASNQGYNKMYINQGNLKFKDVTTEAEIPNVGNWSNGVSIVDINSDGLLDIYITCVGNFKNLKGKNQLLVCTKINNNIPQYIDSAAEYGLNFSTFGTQAAFFDADLDGDLDMYLLNHSVNHQGNYAPREKFNNTIDTLVGDKFLVNNNGKFINNTKNAGIISTKIGYGLGISISDINMDGYPDIYIGNDFHENDYLYINQKNGTFKESIQEQIMHTSQFTMGVDIADINNDALPDIMSVDMLPEDPAILKRSLGEDEYQTFLTKIKIGYNYQYSRNNLQLNRGNGLFSEIGFYAGVSATDWSWSCLMADWNNDSKKDIFVTNGIPKRLNDIDYVSFIGDDIIQNKIQSNTLNKGDQKIIENFPEIKLKNKFFLNAGDAKFNDVSENIAASKNTFSNGAVYADFDNDGDLDIVTNNIKDEVSFYKNETPNRNNYINITLKSTDKNINAIGAKIIAYAVNEKILNENFAVKGFMSSLQTSVHIGIGNKIIDSIAVIWPNGNYQILLAPFANNITVIQNKNLPKFNYSLLNKTTGKTFKDITAATGINYTHTENEFNEYYREYLLFKMNSTEGPALDVADINNDGLDDVFCGSSKNYPSKIFMQKAGGKFVETLQLDIRRDSFCEDVDAIFADVNNDNFKDLIVIGAGNEFYLGESPTQPRLYLNNKAGNFVFKTNAFPKLIGNLSSVTCNDFNNDGNLDVFIGVKNKAFAYGEKLGSYLLKNNGVGVFENVTNKTAPNLENTFFVNSSAWINFDSSKNTSLIMAKDWGGLQIQTFKNNTASQTINIGNSGLWTFVKPIDIDNDGDQDFIAGNQGLNSRVNPTEYNPFKFYYADFDKNETKDQLFTYYQNNKEIPLLPKMDLEKAMPILKKKYLYAADFAKADVTDYYGKTILEKAQLLTATNFSSCYFINQGNGVFIQKPLPYLAQLSPIKDAVVLDYNNDGFMDLITVGNFYEQCMQFNRNDADFGTLLLNNKQGGFTASSLPGLAIKNQARKIKSIAINGINSYIIIRNNNSLIVFQ